MTKLVRVPQLVAGIIIGILIPRYLPSSKNSSHHLHSSNSRLHSRQDHGSVKQEVSSHLHRHPALPIFIGVMTARGYLATRACSVWRTWGADVVSLGGDMRFFVGQGEDGDSSLSLDFCPGLPVVVLDNVRDNAYPPQQKSFMMLAWMWDHYGNTSSWFMRADDDVYVKVEQLLQFITPINSSEAQYLGQAGRGRGLEKGQLDLAWNENFCMGGPGMVFSWVTLMHMRPHINECYNSMLTSHEDVEIGRCVTKSSGKVCTWAYDMQTHFYHSAGGKDDKGAEVEPDSINERVIQHALTIHPLKQPQNMERMKLRLVSLKRRDLRSESQKHGVTASKLAVDQVDPQQQPQLPADPQLLDSLTMLSGTWDLILSHKLYSVTAGGERRKVPKDIAEGLTSVVGTVLDSINAEASEKGRVIEFRDLFYAYVNSDPVYGLTYILDLLLLYKRYKGNKMTVKVRRHVYVRQPFLTPVAMLEDSQDHNPPSVPVQVSGDGEVQGPGGDSQSDTRMAVTFIVPVAGQKKIPVIKRFLDNYEKEVLSQLQPARLILVVFKEDKDDTGMEEAVRDGVMALESNYPGYDFTVSVLDKVFSRAIGMMEGVKLAAMYDLLFLLDVDMQFSADVLDNIRSFTKLGRQVYFPIVFSKFKGESDGYWRDYGYGIMAAHRADIERVNGFNTTIVGWGKEDVDLYDRFVSSNISVFRSPCPQLVHRYHEVTCSPTLSPQQASACRSSRANNYLPLSDLVTSVLNSPCLKNMSSVIPC